jgi:hypothetical protein
VFLQHVRSGGKLYTTKQWADQFLAELANEDQKHFTTPDAEASALPAAEPASTDKPRTAQQREAAIAHAERVVASWGDSKAKNRKSRTSTGLNLKRTEPSATA